MGCLVWKPSRVSLYDSDMQWTPSQVLPDPAAPQIDASFWEVILVCAHYYVGLRAVRFGAPAEGGGISVAS